MKKNLSLDAIREWNSIYWPTLSPDGQWFACCVAHGSGLTTLLVTGTSTQYKWRLSLSLKIPKADLKTAPFSFSMDSRWLVAIHAGGAKLISISSGIVRQIDGATKVAFNSPLSSWIAVEYRSTVNGKCSLLLYNLSTGHTVRIAEGVRDWTFRPDGRVIAWIKNSESGADQLICHSMGTGIEQVLYRSTHGELTNLGWSTLGENALIAVSLGRSTDPGHVVVAKRIPLRASDPSAIVCVVPIPDGKIVPTRDLIGPRLAADGKRLIIPLATQNRTSDRQSQQTERVGTGGVTSDKNPIVWHWRDRQLPSRRCKTPPVPDVIAIVSIEDGVTVSIEVGTGADLVLLSDDRYAIYSDHRPYERETSMCGLVYRDLYIVNTHTGDRRRIETRLPNVAHCDTDLPSPDGRLFLYWNGATGEYIVLDAATGSVRDITRGMSVSFVDDDCDYNVPFPPIPPVGWCTNSRAVVLCDGWDLWIVPIGEGKPSRLTPSGRETSIRYRRVTQAGQSRGNIDLNRDVFVHMYGEQSKREGIARITCNSDNGFHVLLWDNAKIWWTHALQAETLAYSRQTFVCCPDWFVVGTDHRLTNINPQQADYNWSPGTRLINYTDAYGKHLQAALFLPSNYQAGAKYPTIVSIYEKLSGTLHRYEPPDLARIVNTSIYTSCGYAVLHPDIRYIIGEPGLSATECVVRGTEAAIQTGIVDPDRIGLFGHCWGGYQAAAIAANSSLFRAVAVSGGITDLVTMYYSVYWKTGESNQALMLANQGRMAGPFFEHPSAFVRNSPLFVADRINSPMLILHGDNDDVVDFNQAVTLYNALRQLGRQVVLIQYPDEGHSLRYPRNQHDAIGRVRDFFDSMLQDTTPPTWLDVGVSR